MTTATHQQRLPPVERLAGYGDEQYEEVRRQLAASGGDPPPLSEQRASDASGAVTVFVDAGAKVTDVEIGQHWRNRVDQGDLPSALLDAYSAATRLAAEAYTLATVAAREAGLDPPHVRSGPDGQAPPETPSPGDPTEWLVWIHERFAQMRERAECTAAATGPRERTHTGPHGLLTAALIGRRVAHISGDPRRIWYADTGQLREDALALLAATHTP